MMPKGADNIGRKYVFPGAKLGRSLGNRAMLGVIERLNARRQAARLPRYMDPNQGGRDVVPHGFRSTFRDWAAERTNFPREVAEAALAHIDGDETERAYQRGDLFEKRRRLMTAWADYCASKVPRTDSKVRPLRAGMG
jgi:integrase